MRLTPARASALVALPGAAVLLVVALRSGKPEGPRSAQAQAARARASDVSHAKPVPSSPGSGPRPGDPFLQGNPEGIRPLLQELDRSDLSKDQRAALFGRLQKDFLDLRVRHGIHILPLVRRVVTDPALPDGLHQAALGSLTSLRYPQIADFFASLFLGDDLVPALRINVLLMVRDQLRGMNSHEVSPPLQELGRQVMERGLDSGDEMLRATAVGTLETLGCPEGGTAAVCERLLGIFESESSPIVKSGAANALRRCIDPSGDNAAVADRLRAVFARSADPSDRLQVLYTLARTGTPVARRLVLESLSDPSEMLRRSAIWCAAEMNIGEAVSALCALLADPATDPFTKQVYLVGALSRVERLEAAEAVLASVRGAQDPDFRWNALEKLRTSPMLNDPRLAPALAATFTSCPDDAAKGQTARLLAQNPAPEAYTVLWQAYRDGTGELRVQVASALLHSIHGERFAKAALDDLMRIGLDRYDLEVVLKADEDRALRAIETRHGSPDLPREARSESLQALVRLESPASTALLRRILAVETDPDFREEIEEALRRREDP